MFNKLAIFLCLLTTGLLTHSLNFIDSYKSFESFKIANICKNPKTINQKIICNDLPQIKIKNDFENIGLLRSYVSSKMNFTQSNVLKNYPNLDQKNYQLIVRNYENFYKLDKLLQNGEIVGYCGLAALTLKSVYENFNLNSTTYNFGVPETTATHVVTLVEINNKWYLQDPTFDYEISRNPNILKPISIDMLLNEYETYSNKKRFSFYEFNNNNINKNRTMILDSNLDNNCHKLYNGLYKCKLPLAKIDSNLWNDKRYVDAITLHFPEFSNRLNSLNMLVLMHLPIPKYSLSDNRCLIVKDCSEYFLNKNFRNLIF